MIKGLLSLSTHIKLKVNSFWRSPVICVACLAPGDHDGLCPQCRDQLPENARRCYQCALPLPAGPDTPEALRCGDCQSDPPPFNRVIAPWVYRFPLDRMISRYKYRSQFAMAHPVIHDLGEHLAGLLEAFPEQRPDLLIPSPMHKQRRRQRGFNQADAITEQLSQRLAIPWSANTVERTRAVPRQSNLNREQRARNLRGIIRVNRSLPRKVALIDDVMTTGATARALTQALQAAGAEDVQVWVLARTPR